MHMKCYIYSSMTIYHVYYSSTGGMTVDWKTDTLYWSTFHNEQLAAYNIITSEVSYSSVEKKRSLHQVKVDSSKNQDGTVMHTVVVDPKRQDFLQGILPEMTFSRVICNNYLMKYHK